MPPFALRTAVAACVAAFALPISSASAAVVFVNAAQAAPVASQDGTSWATAYKDLRAALLASPAGSEFWIATGTYRPTTTTDRTLAFSVKGGQQLLGGFLPGATVVTERDPVAHPTILSGDIGAPGVSSDNTHHVVIGINVPGLRLDGLIIEDGANEDPTPGGNGGGIRIATAGNLVIQDCVIRRCTAGSRGGGASFNFATNGLLRRVVFVDNVAAIGGAMETQNAAMTIASCRFLGNRSIVDGGAMKTISSTGSLIVDCEFSGNVAQGTSGGGGGAISLANGVGVHSSTFVGNTATNGGGAIEVTIGGNFSSITNCLFADNAASFGTHVHLQNSIPVTHCGFSDAPISGTGNGVVHAGLRDPLGPDGIRGTLDDDLRLTTGSEAIDRGAGLLLPPDTADLDGDGNTSETTPIDAGGLVRLLDDQRPDEGAGGSSFLDLGAHEFERPTRVYFVNDDVRDEGDGSSWEKAFAKLQSAIIAMQSEPQPKPVEIWVAEGIYEPGSTREESFMPQGAVTILGGFKGTEWRRSDRRPLLFPSVLSGEIGSPETTDDNTLHVVHFAGDTVYPETVLDGFVISGGNANESGSLGGIGGGVLVSGVARPTVRNCRIIGNAAKFGGGGVAVSGVGSQIALTGSYLGGNTTSNTGGAMLVTAGATGSGVVNCTIAGNLAEQGGGLVSEGAGSGVCALNTIFAENIEEQGPSETEHVARLNGGSLALEYCALPCGATIVFGTHLISLPPAFTLLAGADERIGTLDDDFTLLPTSPLIDAGARIAECGAAVPGDVSDLDDDADVVEALAVDALGEARAIDDPARTNADPLLPIDLGAAERQTPSRTEILLGDLDGNGAINGADLAILLGQWGSYSQAVDLNGDCAVDAADLALLLGGWTG